MTTKHRLARYIIIGLSNTTIDFILLNFTILILHLALFWATFWGFAIGNLIGYLLHSRWTFKFDTKGQEMSKLTRFYLVAAISLALTEIIVTGLTKLGLYYNFSKLAAVVVTAIWAYTAMQRWIFYRHPVR